MEVGGSTDDGVSSSTSVRKGIHFDPGYISTASGMVKMGQVIASLVGFICVQTVRTTKYLSGGVWYSIVSLPGFLLSTIFLLCYVFHVVERFKWLPWLFVEMGYAAAWSILFFIASTVAATRVRADPPWGAAVFFGFLAMLIFGYEAFLKWRRWDRDQLAQGTRSNVATGSGTENEPTGS